MDRNVKAALAHLCYVAVVAVVGLVLFGIGQANQDTVGIDSTPPAAGAARGAGGILIGGAVLYLLLTLWRLGQALRYSSSSDSAED